MTIDTPKPEERAAPQQELVSVPGVMTEKEKAAAELLLSRAKDVGSNGQSEKRVVNPAEMILEAGLVQNLAIALTVVNILVQHGVLRRVGEQESDDVVRYIYVVSGTALESAQTVSLTALQKELHKRLREFQGREKKLRDKRNVLRAERDRINVQITTLDEEMEKVSEEEGAIRGKLTKFDNLLRELSRELSL